MPINVETFPSVNMVDNKSAAFMGMRVEYTLHGKKGQHSFDSHLPHANYDIPSCVPKITANLKDCLVDWCPPFEGMNAVGDFFLNHLCKIIIDPVSDFIHVYSYPEDKRKLEFVKLAFLGGSATIDRITIWFTNASLSYLGNFDFTKAHFDDVPAGGPFHPEESGKIVWQYQHLEYISTSECYASALMSVSVRSNLVESDEELGVYIVPANSESSNSDTSIVQWKELKANDSIDNVGFRIVHPNGELVSYQSGNIFLLIGIRPVVEEEEGDG